MRIVATIAISVGLFISGAHAQEQEAPSCDVPAYLMFGDYDFGRVEKAVKDEKRLNIAVIGTGSSALAGPNGGAKSYPARLQEALRSRLPGIAVQVETIIKPRQTAEEVAKSFEKLLNDSRPNLVIWQTGTVDAMRGVDPEDFRAAVDEGVEALQNAGADVTLMNMQYSPRTESIISNSAYADNMRVVSRDRDAALFDRLALMRHWSEAGTFDLYAATKKSAMAEHVHDCIGRALASQIIEAAHLGPVEIKAPQ